MKLEKFSVGGILVFVVVCIGLGIWKPDVGYYCFLAGFLFLMFSLARAALTG